MPDDKKPAPNKSTARKMTPLEWRKNAIVNLGYEYAYPYTPEQLKQMDEKGEYPKVYDPRKYKAKSSGEGSMNFYNIDGTPASNVEIMYNGETIQDMKKPAMAKPMPVEGRKPIEFGPDYSINPNDNTYTPYVEGAVPIKMKKGGLVGKSSKYALGGIVDATENNIGAIGSAGAAVAGMGAGYLDSTNELNEYGQINKDKATASGALKGASTGATIGLNPALLAATGGLSALAVPVGAGVGAIVANRKAGQANDEAMKEFKKNQLEEQQAQADSRAQEAMRQRDLGYAKGGKIEGKGTGTSDSIVAKVKAGSFVVPAKNSEVAEEIREKVLKKAPTKKASLKQEGGEDVKLSDGEHLFTPEEAMKIEIELGPEIFKRLAPEAEDNEVEDDDESEMASGGKVSIAKAKEILKDGTAHGKPLTDKQKGYFGWLAGGGMKCGGKVKGYGGGGEVTEDKTPYNKAAYPLKNEGDSTMYKMGYDDWKAGDLTNHTDAYNKAFNGKNDIRAKIYVDGFLRSVQEENAAKVELQRKIDEEKRRQSASKPQLTNQQVIDLSKKLAATAAPNPFEEAEVPNLSSLNKYDLERVMKMFKRDYPNLPAPQAMANGGRVAPMKGYAKGGEVTGNEDKVIAEEKKKIAEYEKKLSELEAANKAAMDKAKRDQTRGEERADIIDGLEKRYDDLKRAKKEFSKAKAEFEAIESSLNTYKSQVKTARSAPQSAGEKAGLFGSGRPADDDILKNTKKLVGELENKRKAIQKSQKDIDYASDEKNYLPKTATSKTATSAPKQEGGIDWIKGEGTSNVKKAEEAASIPTTTTPPKTEAVKSKSAPKRTTQKPKEVVAPTVSNNLNEEQMRGLTPNRNDQAMGNVVPATSDFQQGLGKTISARNTPQSGTLDNTTLPPESITSGGGNPANAGGDGGAQRSFNADGLTGALSYGIPLAQSIIGWNELQKQGKRPVDKLDPDYLARIEEAKRREGIAAREAQYGFTPEEKFLLEQQNQGLLNQQRFGARAYSGGSGASALGGERLAINDAFGRGLMTKVQDKNLQLQKQAIAADRGQYVDQLVGNKTEMARRLFGDTMNAWQQNQQTAADLTASGLTNLMAANRYNQFLKNQEKLKQA